MASGGKRAKGHALLLALSVGVALPAQYQRPRTALSPAEEKAIAAGRKGAKPRPVSPRKGLHREEVARSRIFEAAKPSVVYISSATRQFVFRNSATGDVFAIPPGTGTGFLWDDQGHVVTNHHVVTVDDPNGRPRSEAEEIQVTLSNGKSYKARVIGRSLAHDIAVLRVFAPFKDLRPLPIGASKDLAVGHSVLAIGNPFGLDHTLTSGIISALNREIPTSFGTSIQGAIQTDAAINPGNSGGPLLDSSGRLVGMNTSITSTSGSSAGIGFAIPVDTLNRIVPLLIAKGQMDRPALGFVAVNARQTLNLGIDKGVLVERVDQGGLAEKAGIRGCTIASDGHLEVLGDVILGFQGKPIENSLQLLDRLELEPPDAVLSFTILREGQTRTVTIDPKGASTPAKQRPEV